ncbi:hypothetical protein M231_00046 [Tremella mesenterica]|uniref:Uncharacterized protein n=1 Tax=Tremella mesenterica TaxID=5217 RepID=A0A4Q1BWL5_TREME|nr:hypothetical protein M231_00046 [Tremella mesenterica]
MPRLALPGEAPRKPEDRDAMPNLAAANRRVGTFGVPVVRAAYRGRGRGRGRGGSIRGGAAFKDDGRGKAEGSGTNIETPRAASDRQLRGIPPSGPKSSLPLKPTWATTDDGPSRTRTPNQEREDGRGEGYGHAPTTTRGRGRYGSPTDRGMRRLDEGRNHDQSNRSWSERERRYDNGDGNQSRHRYFSREPSPLKLRDYRPADTWRPPEEMYSSLSSEKRYSPSAPTEMEEPIEWDFPPNFNNTKIDDRGSIHAGPSSPTHIHIPTRPSLSVQPTEIDRRSSLSVKPTEIDRRPSWQVRQPTPPLPPAPPAPRVFPPTTTGQTDGPPRKLVFKPKKRNVILPKPPVGESVVGKDRGEEQMDEKMDLVNDDVNEVEGKIEEVEKDRGVIAYMRNDVDPLLWGKDTSRRNVARAAFKKKITAQLAAEGKKVTNPKWRDDGVAWDWVRIPGPKTSGTSALPVEVQNTPEPTHPPASTLPPASAPVPPATSTALSLAKAPSPPVSTAQPSSSKRPRLSTSPPSASASASVSSSGSTKPLNQIQKEAKHPNKTTNPSVFTNLDPEKIPFSEYPYIIHRPLPPKWYTKEARRDTANFGYWRATQGRTASVPDTQGNPTRLVRIGKVKDGSLKIYWKPLDPTAPLTNPFPDAAMSSVPLSDPPTTTLDRPAATSEPLAHEGLTKSQRRKLRRQEKKQDELSQTMFNSRSSSPVKPVRSSMAETKTESEEPLKKKRKPLDLSPPTQATSSTPGLTGRASTSELNSAILTDLQGSILKKLQAIENWTKILAEYPEKAATTTKQIDRTQEEIFRLQEAIEVEKARLREA